METERTAHPEIRSLYVTAADTEQAAALASALLERRLVACANVVPGVRSLYRWRGEVVDEGEVVLICKTAADRAELAVAAVEALHPYDVPCAVAWPVAEASAAYARWVVEATRPEATDA